MKFAQAYQEHDPERGTALAALLCILVIFGGVGAVIVGVANSRLLAVKTIESRLEAERITVACAAVMKRTSIGSARAYFGGSTSDTSLPTSLAFEFPAYTWPTNGGDLDSGGTTSGTLSASITTNFPSDYLGAGRYAVRQSEADPGQPDSLPWRASHSEAITAQATVALSRGNPSDSSDDAPALTRSLTADATIWRIPAGAVRLLCSGTQLSSSDLSLECQGDVVCSDHAGAPASGVAFSGKEFVDSDSSGAGYTAGGDTTSGGLPAGSFAKVYQNTPSSGAVAFDSLSDPPAGFTVAAQGGTRYAALDLSAYNGPSAISVTGSAVGSGLVIIGSSTSGALINANTISIAVDGPVMLAGPNYRYVLVATNNPAVSLFSAATYNATSGLWVLPDSGSTASATTWIGHLFIAAYNPVFSVEEIWSSAAYTFNGSLHLLGGSLGTAGTRAGTLSKVSVTTPSWGSGTIPANPFTSSVRYESIAVCTLP